MLDIGRGNWSSRYSRSNERYLEYSKRLLAMNAPLVLFVEAQFVDFVQHHRKGRERLTRIVTVTVKDLEYYSLYNNISAAQHHMREMYKATGDTSVDLNVPEINIPEYVIIMASKTGLLKRVIGENPFNSSFFYWIDFGCTRRDSIMPREPCWAPNNIMTNQQARHKVVILLRSPIYKPIGWLSLRATISYWLSPKMRTLDDFTRNFNFVHVMGFFFGGESDAVLEFHELYRRIFERALANEFTDDDQTMIALCYLERNDLFYPVLSLHEWFTMFHLFY